jgi:hypothetical protein
MKEREIYIYGQHQDIALPVLYTLVSPTQRPKIATNLNAAKVGELFKKASLS